MKKHLTSLQCFARTEHKSLGPRLQPVFFHLALLVGCVSLILNSSEGTAAPSDKTAAFIEINENFSHDDLQEIRSLIAKAQDKKLKTLVFRFAGWGRSFQNFAELARELDFLASKNQIHTVAYIPPEGAKGMSLLAVFACREISADKFAQLGEVIPPTEVLTKENITVTDEQEVTKKIVSFAKAAGHDPLLARAMADQKMILYQIGRNGQKKLVDQSGFQKLVTHGEPPWDMLGEGPLVSSDRVLLLDGQEALELGLVSKLAADKDELAKILKVSWEDIRESKDEVVPEKDEITDPCKPAEKITRKPIASSQPPKAVVIVCAEMVDEGLFESIKRRTEAAINGGATHIIYEMDTFGGRVDSAHSIYQYILQDVKYRAHTVAYVRTKAISAGALISVACQDIIMKENAQIGDCAPIMMGGTLEGVEREKMESPLRSFFEAAAKTNHYPVALCKAMVTVAIEVYQVKNRQTGKYEYFEGTDLPTNDHLYDLVGKKLINTKDELLTLDAKKAFEYGLSRTTVKGLDELALQEMLAFLENRDGVRFPRPVLVVKTNWSEEMVRWLTSPTVTGILFMVALLGIYAELNSPGLGLPGAVAVVALVVLFGSKYLIGMANWWEIAVFVMGMGLLLVEIFLIPGFGIAGISGVLMMIFALGAMMVGNRPDEFPLPATALDWDIFLNNMLGLLGGFIGFCIGAYLLGRYLPKIPMANRLILVTPTDSLEARSGGSPAPAEEAPVKVGQEGETLSQLRPSGVARFGKHRLNVVARGELIEAGRKIKVVALDGNSIVVKEIK